MPTTNLLFVEWNKWGKLVEAFQGIKGTFLTIMQPILAKK